MDILYVILQVLIILGIIALGAFIIVLIADLILSSFDGHKGIFFNRDKGPAPEPAKPAEEVKQPEPEKTVTPYYEELAKNSEVVKEETKEVEQVVTSVDFQKAAEEQKLINKRTEQKEPVNNQPVFEEEDTELSDAIEEVSKKALKEIADEQDKLRKEEEKRLQEEQERLEKLKKEQEEQEKAEQLKREREEEKRQHEELKRQKEELERELAEERRKEKVKVVKVKESDDNAKELRKLRDDIFSLRRSAFNDLQEVKTVTQEEEIELKLKELDELKAHKKELSKEKEELLKYKNEALNKETELARIAEEKAELERQIKELQKQTAENKNQKPYYTKEYYLKRLDSLQNELKDVEKELKVNKREFIPLQRIKKSYDRDQEKLRRKEAVVAKQKVAFYGVKASANIDPKRKERLDEEVKQLNQLKESVFQCDQVLKQNKDRYPVLEKANRLLTKTYNRLVSEIENVNAALAWYEENEKNDGNK